MTITEKHSILTVCVPDADSGGMPVWRAANAREALAMLRMARVDLLLTGLRLPDMSPWQLIRRVRSLSCPPRWALVATDLSAAEEIEARSLGAIAVLERMPTGDAIDELLTRARRAVTPATNTVTHPRHLVTERIQPSSRESEPCGSNS